MKKAYNILVHSGNLIEELSVGINVFLIFIEKNKLELLTAQTSITLNGTTESVIQHPGYKVPF